jgi:hypothetical protein
VPHIAVSCNVFAKPTIHCMCRSILFRRKCYSLYISGVSIIDDITNFITTN